MSKLLGCTTAFVLVTVAVAIASLVFNILIYIKMNDNATTDNSNNNNTNTNNTIPSPKPCPVLSDINNNPNWTDAGNRLLAAIDTSVDPCEDFYQFSCGKYLADTLLNGQSRKGTYDEAQYNINLGLANYLETVTDQSIDTDQMQKGYYSLCVANSKVDDTNKDVIKSKTTDIDNEVQKYLGFPLFNKAAKNKDAAGLFGAQGSMERQFTGGPFITSIVSSDYKNKNKSALYVSQPALAYPRDYYVLPQFIVNLQSYAGDIAQTLTGYANALGYTPIKCYSDNDTATIADKAKCFEAIADWVVDFERQLAMASWPDTEMRNYKQQYNPYELTDLDTRFKSLGLSSYVKSLVDNIGPNPFDDKIVLQQPTYFAAIDAIFESGSYSFDDFTNYLAIQFILEINGAYGPDYTPPSKKSKFASMKDMEPERLPYSMRRGRGIRRLSHPRLNSRAFTKNEDDIARTGCVDDLLNLMPYGPGYTYVRSRTDRDKVRNDIIEQTKNIIDSFGQMIDTLDWMSPKTRASAHEKSKMLIRNYAWPTELFGDFKDSQKVDAYNQDYAPLKTATTFWDAFKTIRLAMETREFIRPLSEPGDRTNFLQSPAIVNAWYQPERNSITFPFGILNPPYYDLLYPQAYNYAGQGGTAGHELTHGYDDEGVQFGPEGELVDCKFTHCGIMDDESRKGFVDMAQCVVTQYNGKCCPLKTGNVRCVNGATTQGENIADLGGQMAAYRAYGMWGSNHGYEKLVPGLQDYTPNQVFWITYGVSWCMKITDPRLQKQLMTDPHAPSSCRVNQVMQDIPQFGRDFKCKRGSPMYPQEEDRCKVWIGY